MLPMFCGVAVKAEELIFIFGKAFTGFG